MKLDHKNRIIKAHIALMGNRSTVWMAPVCMIGAVHIGDDIPTAATDGRDVCYGTAFLDKLNDAQVRATVYHENWHKAAMHFTIHEGLVKKYTAQFGLEQARRLINMAQDFVINRDVKKLTPFLECWDGIIEYCHNVKYDDDMLWDTQAIAADLAANAKSGGRGKGKGSGGGAGGAQDPFAGGHDDHRWEQAQQVSEEEAQSLAEGVENALRQGEALSREMAGNIPREVGELLEPVVDWAQALRDFVNERARGGGYSTYSKPNRKYIGYGVYMPSTYTETVKTILFAGDMSGSISEEIQREVLSEMQGCITAVCPETVDVMYWDTAVARHEHYEGADVHNIMTSTRPTGGGGTTPSCVTEHCLQKNITPEIVIWLSDGYVGGDWAPELPGHHFWVICHGGTPPTHLPHVVLPRR